MARAIWTGSLSFGLVNVPVGLYAATDDKSIHFNQFQAGTQDRVRNKRVNENTGEEVPYSEIVKGYDIGDGSYVIVSPEELEAIEPGRSREISITDFVDLDDIDPIYYRSSYYLAPQGEQARRAYALLRAAMEDSRKIGIATFVMRGKQYLVAIRPEREVIGLETMYFSDEVRDPAQEIDGVPVEADIKARELETAKLLIDSMATNWEPEAYHDTYRKLVEDLIDQKRKGAVVTTDKREPALPPVVDLMEALRASVAAAGGRKGASAGSARNSRSQKRVGTGTGRSATGAAQARAEAKADAEADSEVRPGRTSSQKQAKSGGRASAASELSKSELYDKAAELGVAGRSKMSRKELEEAVSGTNRRRRAS
jgi:DNA end-binding protein Ku